MAIQFYMDHNVPRAITEGLRAREVSIITALEDGATEMSDPELLDRAGKLRRVLFTRDYNLLQEAKQSDREPVHPFTVLYMLTSYMFLLELAYETWN